MVRDVIRMDDEKSWGAGFDWTGMVHERLFSRSPL